MKRKSLIAAIMAASLAFPLAAVGGGNKDKASGAKSASTSTSNDGSAETMFASLDKNGDGFIAREEAAGTPHEADFAALDKNADGKLSRDEHFVAMEQAAARSTNGSTASSTNSPAGSMNSPAGSTGSSTDAANTKKTY